MKLEHVKHKLPEYLTGSLDPQQSKAIEQHLERCKDCQDELEQYEALDLVFEKESMQEPSDTLSMNFNKMLRQEMDENRAKRFSFDYKVLLKIAAAITLLILSFQAGRLMESDGPEKSIVASPDVTSDQQQIAMLSLMTDESASKRIKGVNYFESLSEVDEEILKVLINKMRYDENKNVRLSAVQAIGKFSASEHAKIGLLSALKTEKDPIIQISLIQTLVSIKEKEAVGPMKKLLQQEETAPFVKEQIEALLPSII